MPRKQAWTMSPGETLILAKSMSADLESSASMAGNTPTVTIAQGNDVDGWTDYTSSFTIASEQVNTSALTTEAGETIAIGKGIVFTLTATTTQGKYSVRLSCDADDGTTPTTDVVLYVKGPEAP